MNILTKIKKQLFAISLIFSSLIYFSSEATVPDLFQLSLNKITSDEMIQHFKDHPEELSRWNQLLSVDIKQIIIKYLYPYFGYRSSHIFEGLPGEVASVAVSHDFETIIVTVQKRIMMLKKNLRGQFETLQESQHDVEVFSVAVSHDIKTIVIGDDYETITVWKRDAKGEFIKAQTFQGGTRGLFSVILVAISRDSRTIVSQFGNGEIRIWRANDTGKFIHTQTVQGHDSHFGERDFPVAVSCDVKTIVSGGNDGIIEVWRENNTGEFINSQTFQGHQCSISSIAISHDSETIVSGGNDGIIEVWRENDAREFVNTQTFQGHQCSISSIAISHDSDAISHDSETIVSGGNDGIIKVWRKNNTGDFISIQILCNDEIVRFIAVSPDVGTIISGAPLRFPFGPIEIRQSRFNPDSLEQALFIFLCIKSPGQRLDLGTFSNENREIFLQILDSFNDLTREYLYENHLSYKKRKLLPKN